MKRKLLTFFVAICMISGLFPSAAFSAVNITELTQKNISALGYQLSGGEYQLTEDVEIDGSLKIQKNQAVTLDLNGHAIQQKSDIFASVVFMEENSSLELNDSGADKKNSLNFKGGYITDGTTVLDAITEDFSGGGIYVSSGAELTMNAGTIYFCEASCAGGIYIADDGKAVMNGGEIKGCVAKDHSNVGGVYVSKNAQFEMNGGKIDLCYGYHNNATLFAAGVENKGIMKMSRNAFINYGYLLKSSTDTSDILLTFGVSNNGILYAGGGSVYGFANRGTIKKYGDSETDFYHSDEMFQSALISFRYIHNTGTINAGIFRYKLSNNGTISGGTFYGDVANNQKYGVVSGGTFFGEIENIYTVTFDTNGGSTAPETQRRANAPASKPNTPTKNGYIFEGWYNGNEKYDFSENVTEDITLKAKWSDPERFSLEVGETYWFDLSDADIPGEINDGSHLEIGENLPDKTLHYVPFTYVGTIESYALKSADDKNAENNLRSMFIADANINVLVSRNELNEKNLIYGKEYASGGIKYIMRSPSGGNTGTNNNMSGLPKYNDWDMIISKNPNLIKTLNTSLSSQTLSFAQDISSSDTDMTVIRGKDSDNYRQKWMQVYKSNQSNNLGYRPLLELPYELSKTDIKTITIDLNGGNIGNNDVIKLAVNSGKPFIAPTQTGITPPEGSDKNCFCYIDENGGIYSPGDSIPADVNRLTAKWFKENTKELLLTETAYCTANCSGTLYIAAYSQNTLIGVYSKKLSKNSEIGKLSDIGIDFQNADTVKAFAWGYNNSPECINAELKITK